VLEALDVGDFAIKINHRRLLDALMSVCGVPKEKFRPICSAIDKLDKEAWEDVKQEMVGAKGLPEADADVLGSYVTQKAELGKPLQLLNKLRADPRFQIGSMPPDIKKLSEDAFQELDTLFRYLEALGCLHRMSFDLSLARGLDYYTGVIFEAVLLDKGTALGSIGAGGRYDDLVNSFCGRHVPTVGMSIGIERIFSLLYKKEKDRAKSGRIRECYTQVLVASVGSNMTSFRMELCKELWAANIHAEMLLAASPHWQKHLEYAFEHDIPYILTIGVDEVRNNTVRFKNLATHADEFIPRGEVVARMQELLRSPLPALEPPPADEKKAESDDSAGPAGSGKKGKDNKKKDNNKAGNNANGGAATVVISGSGSKKDKQASKNSKGGGDAKP